MSRLRPPFLYDRYMLVTVKLLPSGDKLDLTRFIVFARGGSAVVEGLEQE